MPMYEPIAPHPSGVGVFLCPPEGYFRVFRTPGPEVVVYEVDENGDVLLDAEEQPKVLEVQHPPILDGNQRYGHRRYLDWDVPMDTPLTYRIESSRDGATWTVYAQGTLTLEPQLAYSAIDDDVLTDVINPRDAVIVFLSTRLAQLARQGTLYVRSEAHRRRFNVTAADAFGETEAPIIGVRLGGGTGDQGDLGWNFTEERLKLELTCFSFDRRERDSLTRALRGLFSELARFLEDLGASSISYGELDESTQVADPYGYLTTLAVGLTLYTYVHPAAPTWQLVDGAAWVS